jgi:hypothetical protein
MGMSDSTRHDFAFAASYRLPALLFGITSSTAWVRVDPESLEVRFGPWRLRTPVDNIDDVQLTGGFGWLRTAGPAHLSFADRGITFATNGDAAACLSFREPVSGLDPTGRIKHPGATMTVRDPQALLVRLDALRS